MPKAKNVPRVKAASTAVGAPTTPGAALPVNAAEVVAAIDASDLVAVNVPSAFTITQDDHVQVRYEVGAQDMPAAHANHWYAAACGVTVQKSKRSKPDAEE